MDGIVQPAPTGAGTGGTGGGASAPNTTGEDGGSGYVVIWW
ncbi:hypothetical protein ACFYXS_05540 [Streptomyces sp. NPDC002574]